MDAPPKQCPRDRAIAACKRMGWCYIEGSEGIVDLIEIADSIPTDDTPDFWTRYYDHKDREQADDPSPAEPAVLPRRPARTSSRSRAPRLRARRPSRAFAAASPGGDEPPSDDPDPEVAADPPAPSARDGLIVYITRRPSPDPNALAQALARPAVAHVRAMLADGGAP